MSAVPPVVVLCGPGDDLAPWLARVRDDGLAIALVAREAVDARRREILRISRAEEPVDAREVGPGFRRRSDGGEHGSVLIATSGSSGTPRLVELPWPALEASARLAAARVPFGPGDRWHGSLSPAHVGGLMVQVRALVLGGEVRVAPPPRRWADLEGCTHASLVAPQLARLLEDPSDPPESLRAAFLGGGPSAQTLRDAAIARGVPLFVTYGLTESASQVATGRVARGDPATSAGRPLDGLSVSLDPASGEIFVDGPVLAAAIVDGGGRSELPRPFPTRDLGRIDALGRLHVDGRLDAMFISGGRNVHPEEIERALCELPCVRSACVVGVPHPRWGMRPVAFVDLVGAPSRPLEGMLRGRLEPHLLPDAFLVMPSDEAARAKPSRAALAARLAAGERPDVVA